MNEITIKCKKLLGGFASGEALVCHTPFAWCNTVDPSTGTIFAKGHELEGKNVAGKIFIYPAPKGSTFAGFIIRGLGWSKALPKAVIILKMPDHTTMQGLISENVPTVSLPEKNPLEFVNNGDFVEVDADKGLITVKQG